MTEGGLVMQWRREVMDDASSTSSTTDRPTEETWSTAINLKHCQVCVCVCVCVCVETAWLLRLIISTHSCFLCSYKIRVTILKHEKQMTTPSSYFSNTNAFYKISSRLTSIILLNKCCKRLILSLKLYFLGVLEILL